MTPTYDREAILREVREDPVGWPSIDLERLLEAWGFVGRPLIGDDRGNSWGAKLFYHPRHPDLHQAIFPQARVHVAVTVRVVVLIDMVREGQLPLPMEEPPK